MYLGLVLLLVHQTTTQAPSEVAKVDVIPAEAEVQIGQTLQLSAMARDSSGRPLPNVPIKWMGHGEGSVDSTGLLKAGYAGYVRFFAPLLTYLDHLVTTGFVRAEHRAMLLAAGSPEDLFARFVAYQPPEVPKWITLAET